MEVTYYLNYITIDIYCKHIISISISSFNVSNVYIYIYQLDIYKHIFRVIISAETKYFLGGEQVAVEADP